MLGGVLSPYIGAELTKLQIFNPTEIGLILGVANFCAALFPFIIGHLVEKYSALVVSARFFSLATAIITLWLCWVTSYPMFSRRLLALLLIALYLMRSPLTPLLDTLALQVCDSNPRYYSYLRSTGSLGYVIASIIAGSLLAYTHGRIFFVLLLLMAILGGVVHWSLLFQPSSLAPKKGLSHSAGFWLSLDGHFLGFLLAMLCHWLALAPFQYGLTLYMKEEGINPHLFGWVWAISVFSEIFFFVFFQSFIDRYPNRQNVLLVALTLAVCRWILLGLFPTFSSMCCAQILHGPSFALVHTICMEILGRRGQKYLSSYQGFFTACVTGLPTCVGTILAGMLHEHMHFRYIFLTAIPIQILSILLLQQYSTDRFYQSVSSSSSPSSSSSRDEADDLS
jgi:PPP family 3-phenylpropionic acid transporter